MRRITFIAAACAAVTVGGAVPAAAGDDISDYYYFSGNAQDCEDEEFLEATQGVVMNDLGETLIDVDPGADANNGIVSGDVYGDGDQFLDVTQLDDSYVITAIVVKGGPAYTLYVVGDGESPWKELHSPPLGNEQYPGISHWFVCGYQDEEPTTPPTTEPPTEEPTEPPTEEPTEPPTEQPTEQPTETPSEPPTASPTSSPSDSPAPSETPSPSPSDDDGELPDTGGAPAVLIGAALVLMAAGAVALRNRFVKA